MSIWQLGKGVAAGELKEFKKNGYKRWPDPFRNAVKSIEVLACQDTWQARIEMFAIGMGQWAWSAFIPQPTEILRKTLAGSYKCGFYFGLKWGSPLNLLPGGDAGTAFGEIFRPVSTGLFYIWAGSTFFSGLNTWQSLVYQMDMCDLTHDEILLATGTGDLYGFTPAGSPGFYTELWDPGHFYSSPGGAIDLYEPKAVRMNAIGTFATGGGTTDWVEIYFIKGCTTPIPGTNAVRFENLPPGSIVQWDLSYGGQQTPGAFSIYVRAQQNHTGLAHSRIDVARWTTTYRDIDEPDTCRVWTPPVLPA